MSLSPYLRSLQVLPLDRPDRSGPAGMLHINQASFRPLQGGTRGLRGGLFVNIRVGEAQLNSAVSAYPYRNDGETVPGTPPPSIPHTDPTAVSSVPHIDSLMPRPDVMLPADKIRSRDTRVHAEVSAPFIVAAISATVQLVS